MLETLRTEVAQAVRAAPPGRRTPETGLYLHVDPRRMDHIRAALHGRGLLFTDANLLERREQAWDLVVRDLRRPTDLLRIPIEPDVIEIVIALRTVDAPCIVLSSLASSGNSRTTAHVLDLRIRAELPGGDAKSTDPDLSDGWGSIGPTWSGRELSPILLQTWSWNGPMSALSAQARDRWANRDSSRGISLTYGGPPNPVLERPLSEWPHPVLVVALDARD